MYESFPTTRFSAFVLSLWTACFKIQPTDFRASKREGARKTYLRVLWREKQPGRIKASILQAKANRTLRKQQYT